MYELAVGEMSGGEWSVHLISQQIFVQIHSCSLVLAQFGKDFERFKAKSLDRFIDIVVSLVE